MSLAQRRTSHIGTDRDAAVANNAGASRIDHEDGSSTQLMLWQTLSYDAFADVNVKPPKVKDQVPVSMAPDKVPAVIRAAQVCFALLACMLASGIVCGFAALKPILIREGVYHDLCPPDWTGWSDTEPLENKTIPCAEQDIRLNLFFITASIMLNVSTVFAGYTLDNYGRRVCYVCAALILALGAGTMGAAFHISEFDGYVAGNLLLGLGGTFLFVPSFQLANAFPKYSGMIVALVTGAFDASAAVYLFYRMAYEATDGAFKPYHFFYGFLIVPLVILIAEFTLMPRYAYHSRPELEHRLENLQDPTQDVHDSDDEVHSHAELSHIRSQRAEERMSKLDRIESITGDKKERARHDERLSHQQQNSGVWGVLHELPVTQQIRTAWFVLILLLTILQMLRMNYFIATVRAQYRYMLGSEKLAERVNDFFDVALPIAGVVSTPFIGVLLNEVSVVITLAVLTLFIILVGVLNCLPFLWGGYATVVAFCLFRPLYYSAMSDYATKVFGFATFGRIYGTIICISGFLQFVQPALDKLTHGPLHNSPTPINIFLAVAGTIISLTLTIFVHVRGKAFRKDQATDDAVHAHLLDALMNDYGTLPSRLRRAPVLSPLAGLSGTPVDGEPSSF